jgi:uncharacterized membrane protein YidH (DUF202 family)
MEKNIKKMSKRKDYTENFAVKALATVILIIIGLLITLTIVAI